jgi:hypothetical protein
MGGLPVCLDCHTKLATLIDREIETTQSEMNYFSDQISAAAGLPISAPRYAPRPRHTSIVGTNVNNKIEVTNSVVGTINTGRIGQVNQSIDAIQKAGSGDVASALSELTNAILQSQLLATAQKNEAVELLGEIAKQAALPQPERQNSIALVLLDRVSTIAGLAADVTELASKWLPVLIASFTVATGG